MDEREVRLRCLEAAAKAPIVHNEGPATGVLAVARAWAEWVGPAVTLTDTPPPEVMATVPAEEPLSFGRSLLNRLK